MMMTLNDNNGGLVLQQSEERPLLESSGGGGGNVVVEDTKDLKKGPWTAVEDQILMEYVRKHGEGNWNSVQRNSGLNRCGKSCRLRWANHLRPHLKKGAFSPEEERLILELHAKYGNKWARMASQLPGRTDNEIKNYWNTRVKRRLRQGLPLYPHDLKQSHSQSHSRSLSRSLSLSQASTRTIPTGRLTPPTFQNPLQPTTNETTLFQIPSPTQASYLPPLSSPHHPNPTTLTSVPLFDPTTTSSFSSSTPSFTFQRPAPILGTPLRYKRYRDSLEYSPPISPNPQRSTSIFRSSSMPDIASFHWTGTNSMPDDIASYDFSSTLNPSFAQFPRSQFVYSDSLLSPTGSVYPVKSELPSNHLSQIQSEYTINANVSSAAATLAAVNGTHSSNGLLDDLLQEADVLLACGGKINASGASGLLGSYEEKHALDTSDPWLQSSQSMDSSLLEAKPLQDDHHNSMPEDMSELFSYPSTEPVSDWNNSGELSDGHSTAIADANLDFDMQLSFLMNRRRVLVTQHS